MVANINDKYGVRPVVQNGGGEYARMETFALPVGYAKDVMVGDLVKKTGNAAQGGKVPMVAVWEQGDAEEIVGVVSGFDVDQQGADNSQGLFVDAPSLKHYVKNSNTAGQYYVLVITDPDVLLTCRIDNGTLVAGDIGLNIGLTARVPRTGAYPQPGFSADAASKAAIKTLPLRIERISAEVGNDPAAAFAEIHCSINLHARRAAKAGV
jgi:hypothetical protein